MEEALVQGGTTGALITALYAIVAAIKQHKAKSNGGTTYDRLRLCEHKLQELTEDVSEMRDKLKAMHRDVCEFREDVRVWIGRQEAKDEVRRELNK